MLYGRLDGRGIWGRMDTCISMTESLRCKPETITTLLISYTSVQKKEVLIQHCKSIILQLKKNKDEVQFFPLIWVGPHSLAINVFFFFSVTQVRISKSFVVPWNY